LLELRSTIDGAELLEDGERVASAAHAELELDIPKPPSLAEARAAQGRYVGHKHHHFPTCFVCGPAREPGDGLSIFPGDVGGQVAATWLPTADLASGRGDVGEEFLHAALDCPGYFAVQESAGKAVLGRMTARIDGSARPGEPLIVTGWSIASEGRKHHVGTALHDAAGGLIACARSTWITLG
jgi:hypothetical protein